VCFKCNRDYGSSLFHASLANASASASQKKTVSDYTAILANTSWVQPPGGGAAKPQPAFLTYSFPTSIPVQVKDEFGGRARTWTPFSAADMKLAREALAQWGEASGLVFLEVDAGLGDIQFNWVNFSDLKGHKKDLAFAYYPYDASEEPGQPSYTLLSGDVFMNLAERASEFAAKDKMLFVLLHEIGHALGFKHPFSATPWNDTLLRKDLDDQSETVMSYTGDEVPRLGPLDLAAVRAVYGDAGQDGAHLSSWNWDAASQTLTLVGKAVADVIRGTSVNDMVSGHAGNDTLVGYAGADVLRGGPGIDKLFGGAGDDTLMPGDAALARGQVDGGPGIDLLDLSDLTRGVTLALSGDDVRGIEHVVATRFADVVTGSAGAEQIFGGDGDDRMTTGLGTDLIDGGDGNDILDGGADVDVMRGGKGDDIYYTSGDHWGADTIVELAGEGIDTVIVAQGFFSDYILPEQAEIEVIIAPRDSSVLAITGNGLNNIVYGYEDRMRLSGRGGDDTVHALGRDAQLWGGDGDDILYAGSGTCDLRGELGNDTLVGGIGLDNFIFGTLIGPDNVDTIVGFQSGQDHIVLNQIIFGHLLAEGEIKPAIRSDLFHIGASAVTSDQRLVYDDVTGRLLFDADGSGAAEAIQFAAFTPGTVLQVTDLLPGG
jgi:Ca2+-binding RTX toxin-like protein